MVRLSTLSVILCIPLVMGYTVSNPPPRCLNNAGYAQCIQNITGIGEYVNCSRHVEIGEMILQCFYGCCEFQRDCDEAMDYVVTNCNLLNSQNCSSSLQCSFVRFVQGEGLSLMQYVLYLGIPLGTLVLIILFFVCFKRETGKVVEEVLAPPGHPVFGQRPMLYNYPYYYQPAAQAARYRVLD